jgi:hypothetical protein
MKNFNGTPRGHPLQKLINNNIVVVDIIRPKSKTRKEGIYER